VLELEPYRSYLIEIDPRSFDNLSWRIQHKTIAVETDPNHVKMVEIPVSIMSEASGYVAIKTPKGKKGLSRMIVNFYSCDSSLVGRTLTEEDGFFNFMELRPGNYLATLDSAQLGLLGFEGFPRSIAFTINTSEDGVIADGVQFTVISKKGRDERISEDQHKGIEGQGSSTIGTATDLKIDSAKQVQSKTGRSSQKTKQAHGRTDTRSQITKQATGKKDSGFQKSKQEHSSSSKKNAHGRTIAGEEVEKRSDKKASPPFQRWSVLKAQPDTSSRASASQRAAGAPARPNSRKDSQNGDRSPGKKPYYPSHHEKERSPVLDKGSNKSAELKRRKIQGAQKTNAKTAASNEGLKKIHPSRGTHAAKHSASKKAFKESQPLKRKAGGGNKKGSPVERERLLEQLQRLLERSRPQKAEMAFVNF
jgi:hypothetical protein